MLTPSSWAARGGELDLQDATPLPRIMDGRDISPLLRGEARTLAIHNLPSGGGGDDGAGLSLDPAHGMGELLESPHDGFMAHFCGETLAAARVLGGRFKVHWTSGEVGKGVIGKNCAAGSAGVTEHDPPEVYDLWTDPGERSPLAPDARLAREAVRAAEEGKALLLRSLADDSVRYGNQLESMARPWLFPCCKYPTTLSAWANFPASCACDRDAETTAGVEADRNGFKQ